MNKNVIVLTMLLMLVMSIVPVYADEVANKVLTQEEVIKLALEQNYEVSNLAKEVAVAKEKLNQAQAGFLPKVDLNTIYTRFGEEQVNPMTMEGYENNYSVSLKFQQPLYTGGKISNGYAKAKKGLEVAQLNLEKKQKEVKKKALENYYNILKAEKMVEVAKQNLEKINKYVRIAEVNREVGIFTNTDVLQAKVNLNRAQQGLLKAQNGLTLSKLALKNTLRLEDNVNVELAEELNWQEEVIKEADVKEYAFEHRVDLKLLNLQEDILELTLASAKGDRYPNLSLSGDYTTNGEELKVDDGDWKVNLMLSYNIFDGGAKSSKIEESKLNIDKLAQSKKQLKDAIDLQIKQSLLSLTEARESIDLMKLSLSQAKDNLEQTELKYQEGIVTSFDVLDAQTTYQEVQTDYYQAIYDYNLALAELDKIIGKPVN